MTFQSDSVASRPSELLRFVPTLLTLVVLGGAAIIAMGGFKHHPAADATTAPRAIVPASIPTAPLSAMQPDIPRAAAEVLYIVDSPKVQQELETSPILKRGSGPVSFSALLVQTPEDESAAARRSRVSLRS